MSGDVSQPERSEGQISEEEYLYDEAYNSEYNQLPEDSENYEEISQDSEENTYSLDQEYEDNFDNENYTEENLNDESYENYEDNLSEESLETEEYNEEQDFDEIPEESYESEEVSDSVTENQVEDYYESLPEESFETDSELNEEQQNDYSEETQETEQYNEDEYFDEIPEESYESEEVSELENEEQSEYSNGEESEEYYDELPEESFVEDNQSELNDGEYIDEGSEEFAEEFSEENIEVEEDPVKDETVAGVKTEEETTPEEPVQPKFTVPDVQAEIHQPVPLENTANYLMSLPILGDVVKEKYLENIKKETDDVKLRALRVATQKEIIAQFKEQKQPYIITHFTSQENLCTVDKNCLHKSFKSVYFEVSNPVTNKNVMLTSHMYHNMTRHHMVYFNEPLLNLGNSPQGFFDSYLPCADLMTALKNSNVPQEVLDELEAVKEKIEYLEYERFAAVRGNVQYDMSVFEQNEYEKEHNIIPFYAMLRTMVEWGAEDIHIKAGFRPMGVLGGDVKPCPSFPEFLAPDRTKYYSNYLMTPSQQQQFEETLEMDNSFYVPGVARFRCNMYHSQGNVGMVFRVIPTKIRPVEVLGVPLILKKLVFERLGLVLVTGQTGSGKTTTLAAIVEFCNVNRAIHILTLENPVEYVYESKKAIFTQRAIEIDSLSFPMAMRGALRQKPDIILIGEMRDPDTIMAGLKAAETGHLVMSTLHTNDAVQTINRIVNTFPPHEQETIRVQVGSTIKACVAQRLIPRFDKPGRVCSIEVMLVTPNARGQNTRGYIIRNEVPELYKVVATSDYDGMQSMNMALFEHYKNGVITPDDALSYSDNPDEITRWMREDMGLGASM